MPELYQVCENGEYGTFFVESGEGKTSDDRPRFFATWCCVSSYGVFGHYWSHMGEPFAQFIQDIEPDYLLGKIARRETDAQKTIAAVRRQIIENRKDGSVTKDDAREAMEALREIEDEGWDGGWTTKALWDSHEISKALHSDYMELTRQEWANDAKQFVKKLWPAFVKAVGERAAASV